MTRTCEHCRKFTPSPIDGKIGKCWGVGTMPLPNGADAVAAATPCEDCPAFTSFDDHSKIWRLFEVRQVSEDEYSALMRRSKFKYVKLIAFLLIIELSVLFGCEAMRNLLMLGSAGQTSVWG